jgi:predicted RNase H-like nuclease (RuvC/YqgF family)
MVDNLIAVIDELRLEVAMLMTSNRSLERSIEEKQRKLLDLHDEVVRLTARLNEAKGHGRDRGKASVKRGFGSSR